MSTRASPLPPIVVGALNLDMYGLPQGPARLGDSTPGRVTLCAGGVGHNIAMHIAQAGVPVELLTLLGDDSTGDMLMAHCLRDGIGMTHATRLPGPSSTYLCIHEQSGELLAGINDMSLMEAFTPQHLRSHLDALNRAPLVCVDANLPLQTLSALAHSVRAPLLLDPVSAYKAERVRAIIGRFTAVKPNQLEAECLSGHSDPARAADWFLSQGVQQVYISLSKRGVYYADRDTCGTLSATPMQVPHASGAGDALAAGIAVGMLRAMDTYACAQLGLTFVTQYLLKQGGVLQ